MSAQRHGICRFARILPLFGLLGSFQVPLSGQEQVWDIFFKAVKKQGYEYAQLRQRILDREEDAKPYLKGKAENREGPWEELVLAKICLTWIEHPRIAKRRTRKPIKLGYPRGTTARVEENAALLRDRFKRVPMLLVEELWKGSTLELEGGRKGEYTGYLARALVLLNEKDGVKAMEQALLNPGQLDDWLSYEHLARALGELSDDSSVPTLVKVLPSKAPGYTSYWIRNSIIQCASEKSLPLLRDAAEQTEDEKLKQNLKTVIEYVEKKLSKKAADNANK